MINFKQYLNESSHDQKIKNAVNMLNKFQSMLHTAEQDNKAATLIDSIKKNISEWENVIKTLHYENHLNNSPNDVKIKAYEKAISDLEKQKSEAKYKDTYSGNPSHGGTHLGMIEKKINEYKRSIDALKDK